MKQTTSLDGGVPNISLHTLSADYTDFHRLLYKIKEYQCPKRKITINLIVFVVALFILAEAYRILIGDGSELKLKDGLSIKINPAPISKELERNHKKEDIK